MARVPTAPAWWTGTTSTTVASISDSALATLSIPARNALLDELEAERDREADYRSEAWAEGAWLRAAEQGDYAGSEEEARDRWLDSLHEGS